MKKLINDNKKNFVKSKQNEMKISIFIIMINKIIK